MKPVTLLVVGAGDRGSLYARWSISRSDRVRVVGIAEPIEARRARLAADLGVPAENLFTDWREAAGRARFADAVVIATLDDQHADPAIAFAEKGYHLLLEKPMAPTEEDCERIVAVVKRSGVLLAVGHVLLYNAWTRRLRELLAEGRIGEIVSLDRLEPIGWWHFAHSYVRGNWRREEDSSFLLLTKSCHDLDWIRHVVGERCLSVASFGSLAHFRREAKPAEAGGAVRCLDCAHEPACPYSAPKLYMTTLQLGWKGWPVSVVTDAPSEERLRAALATGPYGRCVYESDNDVVDNQVVILRFAGGKTASFTLTAFTEYGLDRKTRIFGTRGQIEGDGATLRVTDFVSGRSEVIDTGPTDPRVVGGHGGGDAALMDAFVRAVAANDPSLLLSGPDETLESHRMVFAAERARREHRVVDL
ncbi:MAG: Gfo/Idh/MocA family oxidoreductase [Deltaproteobacteria bacterium]|nr:Gfo/Idh/MocA family oxidoreductase [Deltaproteobacteria bacterium]